MATKPTKRPRVPRAAKAKAVAKVLVDGKSNVQAAREVGTSEHTVRRALAEVETSVDLAKYVEAYRAKALPVWLEVIEAATERTKEALPRADARDAAAVAKTYAEMSQRAIGEADVKHEHAGSIDGARDALAARLAALSDGGAKG